MSKTMGFAVVAAAALVSVGSTVGQAQQAPPQSPNMTFFVTSNGPGKGADLGGLEGAYRQCQTLAQAAGAGGKTWHAYLSTQTVGDAQTVSARDRIGPNERQRERAIIGFIAAAVAVLTFHQAMWALLHFLNLPGMGMPPLYPTAPVPPWGRASHRGCSVLGWPLWCRSDSRSHGSDHVLAGWPGPWVHRRLSRLLCCRSS
jgi:hypothetical protein